MAAFLCYPKESRRHWSAEQKESSQMAVISAILGGVAGLVCSAFGWFYFDLDMLTAFWLYISSGVAAFALFVFAHLSLRYHYAKKEWMISPDAQAFLARATSNQD